MKYRVKNIRKITVILLLLSFFIGNAAFAQPKDDKHKVIDTNKVIEPEPVQKKVASTVTMYMTMTHYKKTDLNDSLSELLYLEYLKNLDYGKLYFTKTDIESFDKNKRKMNIALLTGNLTVPYQMFNLMKQRLTDRMRFVVEVLKNEPDFTLNEVYYPDRKDSSWANSNSALDEIWRKKLKSEALSLKLGGKSWKDVSDVLTKRYTNFHKFMLQYTSEDVFQLFMNAFTAVIDPHSAYFSPNEKDNFNINLTLSLEGIGTILKSENDYTVIANVVPGSPAAASGKLGDGDKIVGVAQADTGSFADIFGWRIDDVVQLIRGPKGTKVRLQVLKANAPIDAEAITVTLVRDKIKLEEQAAKKEIKEFEQDGKKFKVGVINVPAFYLDFEGKRKGEKDYKSTSRDVAKLLAECKAEGVNGIIIDLRNNGGGSLLEAIDLTGLFIKTGPVVQVRDNKGFVEADEDNDPSVAYDGPMMVLVNRYSASASEIFSAAIQDYHRGIIVGEQSFGKGTVQQGMNLNNVMNFEGKKLGQLNITIAKFYRINGGSTQHRGVTPDILFPSAFKPGEVGESSMPYALPWDSIPSANYDLYGDFSKVLPRLTEKFTKRFNEEKDWKFFIEDLNDLKVARAKKYVSLNEEKRKEENKLAEEKKKLRNIEKMSDESIEVTGDEESSTPSNANASDTSKKKPKDVLLDETTHILADFINLQK